MPISNDLRQEVSLLAQNAIQTYWQDAHADRGIAEMHLNGSGAVAALEAKLKQHYDKQYALCVSNATTGLLAIALALGLRDADIVTTPLTYGASLAGLLLLGNRPVFASLEPQTLTLDPESVRQQITPQTQAILAVDMLGNPCDAVGLRQVADEFGLWYIADAAQSLGASRQGLPASALADAIAVSFTVGKSVFAGEGGAILTDNAELYQKLIWWTQHPDRQRRDIGLKMRNSFGLNGRIHPLAAVIANATFEASLQCLQQRQAWGLAVLDTLNHIGMTQPTTYRQDAIAPSFFRLCAAWQGAAQEQALVDALRHEGYEVCLDGNSLDWLTQEPAFVAQYGDRWTGQPTNFLDLQHYFCLENTRSNQS